MNKKAIVIGSGFGGMAAAIRLRSKGYNVEIVDRCNNLGGRAQVFNIKGFKHDAGPTLITAPFLIKELFECVNENIDEYIKFIPLEVWYRFIFDDGTKFDYCKSVKTTIKNISFFSKEDAKNYPKLLKASKEIYDIAFRDLAHIPFHRFITMMQQIPSLLKLKSYQSVYGLVSKHLKNEKMRRAFSIQPLLVGGNPFTTTSIYSLIHYLERAHGVFFASGGTGNLVNALGTLMTKKGVKISLNTTIDKIEVKNNLVDYIVDNKGQKKTADLYVSNIDPIHLYENLINKKYLGLISKTKIALARHSMGLFVLFFGTKKVYKGVEHHTILFGKEYKELLKKIFKGDTLPKDISLYLHRPTATDKSFAPKGCDSFYALVPVPNLKAGINWKKEGNNFKKMVINLLEKKVLKNLNNYIVNDFYMTPDDFHNNYLSSYGTGFSLAPYFTQSAWFRFHNKSKEINNLYLVGAGSHPGAGIPGVLSSAKVLENLL